MLTPMRYFCRAGHDSCWDIERFLFLIRSVRGPEKKRSRVC